MGVSKEKMFKVFGTESVRRLLESLNSIQAHADEDSNS